MKFYLVLYLFSFHNRTLKHLTGHTLLVSKSMGKKFLKLLLIIEHVQFANGGKEIGLDKRFVITDVSGTMKDRQN